MGIGSHTSGDLEGDPPSCNVMLLTVYVSRQSKNPGRDV